MERLKNFAYGVTGIVGIDSTSSALEIVDEVSKFEVTATEAGTIIDLILKAIVAIVTVIGILKKKKKEVKE